MLERPPEPWNAFLMELDRAVSEETLLHCMGGFVVTLLYGFQRPTADIDVLSVYPRNSRGVLSSAGRDGPLHRKYRVYLDQVGIAHVPENYDERLVPMYARWFQNLRLFALDPYDLALSKIERNIERDREDVKHLARMIPLELKVLRERYESELRWQLGRPEREDITLRLWIEMIEEIRSA